MTVRISPKALVACGFLVLTFGLLVLAANHDPALASSARITSCGEITAPKNDNGFKIERTMKVKAEHLGCHRAKKTLKKFVKTFNANDHTNVNGFDCRIPQRSDGSVFYSCRKGNKLAKGLPKS